MRPVFFCKNSSRGNFFGNSAGCPATDCNGFELTRTLDFDTNADGKLDKQDAYWNEGKGWLPIGILGKSSYKPSAVLIAGLNQASLVGDIEP